MPVAISTTSGRPGLTIVGPVFSASGGAGSWLTQIA